MLGNGLVSLTNPDEVFYAQTAKEMREHHTWMTPYLFDNLQFEKPVFLYWLLRVGFAVLGVNSFSARLFPAIFAMIGVLAVYALACLGWEDKRKAFVSGLVLMSGGFYIGLARTVFTDMIFSVFILLALASFFWGYARRQQRHWGMILFFVFSGCAVLSKGPLGCAMTFMTALIFLAIKRDFKFLRSVFVPAGLMLFLVITVPWYFLMIKEYGRVFLGEFFYNDHIRRFLEAEHAKCDTWYFYPGSMIGGMFPWSLYSLSALVYFLMRIRRRMRDVDIFLLVWMAVVMLTFQPAHSKLASYIFPLFPALALVTGDFICDAVAGKRGMKTFLGVSWIMAVFLAVVTIVSAVCVFVRHSKIAEYVPSRLPFAVATVLFALITVLFAVFIFRRRFLAGMYTLSGLILAIFCIIPLIDNDVEPFISSRDTAAYLMKNYDIDTTILCSKKNVRGIRYYTGKNVAVINPYGRNFFSPHPIPFLDSDERIRDFLSKQPVTYAVLTRSLLADMKRQEQFFEVRVLQHIGDQYIVKVSPLRT